MAALEDPADPFTLRDQRIADRQREIDERARRAAEAVAHTRDVDARVRARAERLQRVLAAAPVAHAPAVERGAAGDAAGSGEDVAALRAALRAAHEQVAVQAEQLGALRGALAEAEAELASTLQELRALNEELQERHPCAGAPAAGFTRR
ncbi:hypothetical protein [Kineococcus sp. SYSU DK005]|uniref:hypothetical protein n=1 Tax=Kineococcus sp. SYSU DK005 TaxID=3383126 RepID=UPI003D7DA7F1